jgi:hypothetical protein
MRRAKETLSIRKGKECLAVDTEGTYSVSLIMSRLINAVCLRVSVFEHFLKHGSGYT